MLHWQLVALALGGAAGFYLAFGILNLDLADEGFLWYGVLRTRAGDVPLRDFQAYDPGRYYWSAAGSFLFGQGLLGLRASLAVAQGLGLFFGLLVCRRLTSNVVTLAAMGTILAAWMFPRHKLFEPAISMAAVWVGVRLLEAPSSRRLFAAGAFAGLAAWFGRNHGLYCVLAFAALIALLVRAGRIQSAGNAVRSFVLGIAAGSAPLWIMLLVVPGFPAAFWDSIVFHLTQGLNIPLPYPWPWRIDLHGPFGFDLVARVGTVAAFALPLLLYPLGLVLALRTPPDRQADRAVLISATSVGTFYLHHASIRSDVPHLAQAIHPLLLLVLAIPASMSLRRVARSLALGTLGAITVVVALNANQSLKHLRSGGRVEFVVHEVAGERLKLPAAQALQLRGIEAAIRSRVGPGDRLFVAPTGPGFYPVFNKTSPAWWLYFLWPATDAAQRGTIERLEAAAVEWALIIDDAIDGNEALRFRNSNPQVRGYLNRIFVGVEDRRLPPNYLLLRRQAVVRPP
jgi:hypothetical protein